MISRWVRVRIWLATILVLGAFGAIGYKAWTVQIRDGARMTQLARAQYVQKMDVPAPRGTIYDRNGVELAASVTVDSIWANPREIADPALAARALAGALKIPVRSLQDKLSRDRGFVYVKRWASPEEAAKVRALGLDGVGFLPEPKRYYPGGSLAGPVLGFTSLHDDGGVEGIEKRFDDLLRGEKTSVPALRDARGRLALVGGAAEGKTGATVTLTLDRYIQFAAERVLAETIEKNEAQAGMIVVLDPRTGDVLGMASWPTFDPNDAAQRGEGRNRTVADAFEPGSVMKTFVVAAAVDAGVVRPTDLIDVEGGRLQLGSKTWTDTHSGPSLITVSEVIKVSSNVGAAKIGRRLGKERLAEALKSYGFGARSGIELPGERAGVIRDTKRWGEIGLVTASFGYGLTVTPLQVAAGMGAIANGGVYLPPGIVKSVVANDGRSLYARRPEGRRVMKERTARDVTAMMKTVFEEGGTGERLKVPGFRPAGKTGTAHKIDRQTGRYARNYLASFVGFVPADDPRLVIVVMIDDPRGGKYFGGTVAGPAFASLADECLKYLGVPATEPVEPQKVAARPPSGAGAPREASEVTPEEPPDLADLGDEELPPAGPNEEVTLIPDFTGMSMAEALGAAEDAGVRIEVEGTGRATGQFPAAGRALRTVTCRVTFAADD